MTIANSKIAITSGTIEKLATTGFGDPCKIINLGPGDLFVGSLNVDQSGGTSAFTNGIATVVGTGTNYTSWVEVGDRVRANDSADWGKVLTVDSDIQLTLTAGYTGIDHTGQLKSVNGPLSGFKVNVSPIVGSELPLSEYAGEVWGYADGGNCDVRVVENIAG